MQTVSKYINWRSSTAISGLTYVIFAKEPIPQLRFQRGQFYQGGGFSPYSILLTSILKLDGVTSLLISSQILEDLAT